MVIFQILNRSWRAQFVQRITPLQRYSPNSPGWDVLILCSTLSVTSFHRTFAQFATDFRQPSVASWLTAKQNYVVAPLSSGDVVNVARMSDMAQFRRILGPLLIPRISGTPANAQVRTYISDTLTPLGYTIELDSFTGFPPFPFAPTTFTNIIATLDPAAPRRLVLACHFDSKIIQGADFIGATDSAVPCAMILDVAVTLGTVLRNQRTANQDITLQFMFFDGEEAFNQWSEADSLYGSRHLAEKLALRPHPTSPEISDLAGIDLFVLLDLIGGSDVTFRNFFQESSKSFERFSAIENTLLSAGQLKHFNRGSSYFPAGGVPTFFRVEDDHLPFQKHGVSILHLIPVPFPPVWHTVSDDENHLDYSAIEDLNTLLRVFVCEYLTCRL